MGTALVQRWMILIWCLPDASLSTILQSVDSSIVFRKVSNPGWGPPRSPTQWKSASLTSCIIKCMSRYSSSCGSVLYNRVSYLCTPGQRMTTYSEVPSPEEGDLYAPYSCNTTSGFVLYSYQDMKACLLVSQNYYDAYEGARSTCTSLGSFLYSVKTLGKFLLLQQVVNGSFSGQEIYVGLNDIITEGTFIYEEDGTTLDPLLQSQTFAVGEPNNYGDENCITMKESKLNDIKCIYSRFYICERSIF